MGAITLLASQAKVFTVLYVEDNRSLNQKVEQFLHKFFAKVFVAYDGIEGLQHYKEYQPDIVITDIKMPKLDGIELSKKIKFLDPNAKILILSAYDDKEFLYRAIELGVFRFIKKPIDIEDFTKILLELVLEIKHEKRVASLKSYEASGNLVAIFENKKLQLANNDFLHFFGIKDEEDFESQYPDLDKLFENQKGFLYSSNSSWYDKLTQNVNTSYQVIVKNKKDEPRHLILKANFIDDKAFENKNDILLSFTDITDLNLLPIAPNQKHL